jgi:hypothetical protein
MISINRDTISIVVALLVAAAGYYLFVELNKQKGDIERCKTFSIELANKVHAPAPPPMAPHTPHVSDEAPVAEEEE